MARGRTWTRAAAVESSLPVCAARYLHTGRDLGVRCRLPARGRGGAAVEWVEGYEERRGAPVGNAGPLGHANAGMPREVEVSFKCPNGHVFFHECGNFNNSKKTAATATTIQVSVSKGARKRERIGLRWRKRRGWTTT